MIEEGKINVTLITLVGLGQGFGVRVGDLFESSRRAEAPSLHPDE